MKKNNATKELLLEQLRRMPVIETACQKAGISRMTLSRWRREDSAFSAAVDAAILDGRSLANDVAESSVLSAIKNGNLQASTYWLKHHHKDYGNKLEISGTIKTRAEFDKQQRKSVEQAIKHFGALFPKSYDNPESKDPKKSS